MQTKVFNLLCTPEAINQLILWARQAGEIALHYFRNINPQYKPNQSLLTQADLEIEYFLAERLRSVYPDFALIGEEASSDKPGHASPYAWVIDPIDGTTAFVQGLPGWGISLGLLHHGQPHFGLFYMPLLDDMTYTTHHNEVYCNGLPLSGTVRQNWGQKGFLAVNTAAHYDFQINIRRTRALGSVGANLIYTARGASVGAFIPKAYLWDLVAGAAILTQAGGELRYLSGRPVNYLGLLDGRLAPEPIIASHPTLQAELQAAIRPQQTL